MITKEHATETLQMEFGKGSYAIPNVHYLGLSTSAISEDTGTGFTEPTDANYSRKALTNVAATLLAKSLMRLPWSSPLSPPMQTLLLLTGFYLLPQLAARRCIMVR